MSSLRERLIKLGQQEKSINKQLLHGKKLREQAEEKRQQGIESRRENLRDKANNAFIPILMTVNDEYLSGRGNLDTLITSDGDDLSATSKLIWDRQEGEAILVQHQLKIQIDEKNNLSVIGGDSIVMEVDSNSAEWREQVDDAIIEILNNRATLTLADARSY